MKLRLVWTRVAVQDLTAMRDWLGRHNPQAAQEQARLILAAAQRLTQFPGQGKPGRVPDTRELVIARTPYVLPYTVHDDQLVVLAVLHQQQVWPRA
jgi:toxin ParE1/3/4